VARFRVRAVARRGERHDPEALVRGLAALFGGRERVAHAARYAEELLNLTRFLFE
jgi:hypothetical protein